MKFTLRLFICFLTCWITGCGAFHQISKSKNNIEMPLVFSVENTGVDYPEPTLLSIDKLPVIESLPDPFEWSDGGRISKKSDWRKRRAEIGAEIQHYELGKKPAPPEKMEAEFVDGVLRVTVHEGENSIELTAIIKTPKGEGPFPAIIGVAAGGTGCLPEDIFTSRGIARITYNEKQISPQWPKRGEGAFYKLYPDTNVGSFIAWAWGVSRIIDGLEITPEAKIDVSKLAISGCSYAGKIALFSGAFDERIALTIPQEPGGGGDAAWRVSDSLPQKVETLRNAQGVAWYRQDVARFNEAVTKLPYDHHELMAMVAPRALYLVGNPDYQWLAEESGYVSCKAAHEVWKALGVPDRFGFSKVAGHSHCRFPDSQREELIAFVEKFLLGNKNTDTKIARSPYSPELSNWITWETPDLK